MRDAVRLPPLLGFSAPVRLLRLVHGALNLLPSVGCLELLHFFRRGTRRGENPAMQAIVGVRDVQRVSSTCSSTSGIRTEGGSDDVRTDHRARVGRGAHRAMKAIKVQYNPYTMRPNPAFHGSEVRERHSRRMSTSLFKQTIGVGAMVRAEAYLQRTRWSGPIYGPACRP